MTDWNPKANEIFLEALDVIDPVARRDFVTRRCAGNDSLRDVVEALLADAANVGSSFLAQPAANELRQLNDDSLETQSPQGANEIAPVRELGTTCASTRDPNAPCTMIGPYKLLPCIGEAPILKLRFLAPLAPFSRGELLDILWSSRGTRRKLSCSSAQRHSQFGIGRHDWNQFPIPGTRSTFGEIRNRSPIR